MDKSIHVLHDLTQENTRAKIHILQDLTRETYMSFYQNLSHEDTHMSHTHVTHTQEYEQTTRLYARRHTRVIHTTRADAERHTRVLHTTGPQVQRHKRDTYYKISHKKAHVTHTIRSRTRLHTPVCTSTWGFQQSY